MMWPECHALKMTSRNIEWLARILAMCWLWVGILPYIEPLYPAVPLEEVLDNRARYEGKTVIVEGMVQLGFEAGSIFTPGRSRIKEGIALGLENWVDIVIGYLATFDTRGIVQGVYHHREGGRFGTWGLFHSELQDAKIIRWPWPMAVPLFMLLHVLPAAFGCYLVHSGVKSFREARDMHHVKC